MRRTHTRVMEEGQGKAPFGSGESTRNTGNFVVLRDLDVTVIRLRTQPNCVRSANEWRKQLRFYGAQKYWNLRRIEQSRLQFRTEFFNLLNRTSFYPPRVVFGDPIFGQVSQAWPARSIHLGLQF